MDQKTISEVMREMGSKGGRIGGKATAAKMTQEELSSRGTKAAAAREAGMTDKKRAEITAKALATRASNRAAARKVAKHPGA